MLARFWFSSEMSMDNLLDEESLSDNELRDEVAELDKLHISQPPDDVTS